MDSKSRQFLHSWNIQHFSDSKIIAKFVGYFSNEKIIINGAVRGSWFIIDLYSFRTTSIQYLVSFKVVFIDTGNLVGLIVQTIFSLDILQWCALFLYIVYVCFLLFLWKIGRGLHFLLLFGLEYTTDVIGLAPLYNYRETYMFVLDDLSNIILFLTFLQFTSIL